MNTSGAAVNIQDLVKITNETEPAYYDPDLLFQAKAPHLQIPNRTGGGMPEMYYYLQDAYYQTDEWDPEGNEGEGDYKWDQKAGWADEFGILVLDVTVTPGMAFWIKNQQSENKFDFSITTPGQVPALSASYDNTTAAGEWFLASGAFPSAPHINSALVEVKNPAPAVYDPDLLFQGTASHMQIPNRAGSGMPEMYYYLQDAYYQTDEWDPEGNEGEGDYKWDQKAGWADEFGILVTDPAATIPVGTGFWLKSSTALTLTFHGSAD